jgi:hypothetical protein
VPVIVLGPQRWPTVDQVVAGIAPDARLAVVTAGWQEREPDDAELGALLGGRGVNLGLYARWMDVLERDRELARAELDHRAVLDELQQLYLVQVDAALAAAFEVARLSGERPRTGQPALEDALAVVRRIDSQHLARVQAAHRDFYAAWRPEQRQPLAEHREQVRALLQGSAGLVVAGGHVGVLLRVLHLFYVAPFVPPTVIAWSAGAMALTERVVLFHDRSAHGPAQAEVYDDGLGLIRGLVLLPHARRRLRVNDRLRMSVLARRFAPACCVVLDDGVRVDLTDDADLPPGARVIDEDGAIRTLAGDVPEPA